MYSSILLFFRALLSSSLATSRNSKMVSCLLPSSVSNKNKKDSLYSYFVAISIAFCQAEIMGLYASMPVFLKSLSNDATLGFPSESTLSFAQSVVMLIMPFSGILAGFVTDKYGARLSLFIASLGAVLGPLFFAWASEFGGEEGNDDPATHKTRIALMITSYGFTLGFLALGFMTAPGPAIVGSWFNDDLVSFGVGIGECGVAAGTALMPLAAGLLLHHFDPTQMEGNWRSAMKLLACFGVIPMLLSFVTIQRPHDDHQDGSEEEKEPLKSNERRFEDDDNDTLPILEQSAHPSTKSSVNNNNSGFIPDDNEGEEKPQESSFNKSELSAALKTKTFLILFATQFLFGVGYFQFLFAAVPLAKIMGSNNTIYADADVISPTDASALMTPFGITSAIGALVFGALASKLNNRVVLAGSQLIGGILITFVVPVLRTYVELAVVYAIIGAVASSALTTIPSMVVESFISTPHLINSIMSVSFAAFGVAGAVAPPMSSAIQEAPSQEGSYRWAFFVGGICMLILGVFHGVVEVKNRFGGVKKHDMIDENNDNNYGTSV